MDWKNGLLTFLIGGTVTTLISSFELSNNRLWSGFAALVPVFTLVSYIFIGQAKGGLAVSQNAKFVLVGTIVAWMPYMISLIVLAPRLGASKAIGIGLLVFSVLCALFMVIVEKRDLFS